MCWNGWHFLRKNSNRFYADCAIPAEDCDKSLSVQAFTALAEQLRKSSVYRNFVQEKSQAAETAAMAYLEQAGLLRDVRIGIVDSGWNGSMQNCLMTLLEKGAGKPLPNLKGYYFGCILSRNRERGRHGILTL